MKTLQTTKQAVRNYLINRSFLSSKAKSINEVLDYLTCIQVDPINKVARSHEFALYNRVKGFETANLYKELYEKKTLTEYWLQLYSIMPLTNFAKLSSRLHADIGWRKDYLEKHRQQINSVVQMLANNPIISYKELSHLKGVGGLYTWKESDSPKALLEYLWDQGMITIVKREGNTKYYSLTKEVHPELKFAARSTSQKFILESQFRYLGIVRKGYFGKYGANYKKAVNLTETFELFKSSNRLIRLIIPNLKTEYFMLADQLSEFEKHSQYNSHEISILSPLDPIVIDRQILSDVFDFDYRWEAYTPAAKRKFSHYGMPLLYKGSFEGQLEIDRTGDSIQITKLQLYKKDQEKNIRNSIDNELKTMSSML